MIFDDPLINNQLALLHQIPFISRERYFMALAFNRMDLLYINLNYQNRFVLEYQVASTNETFLAAIGPRFGTTESESYLNLYQPQQFKEKLPNVLSIHFNSLSDIITGNKIDSHDIFKALIIGREADFQDIKFDKS